jgi:hypothetical protein
VDTTQDASLLQDKNKDELAEGPAPAPALREESHHVKVQYEENAGSPNVVRMAPQSNTKYIILPGSPDGVVPPVEIDGDLFNYCSNQMSEIMMGFAQTARMTVQMTKDWCSWQSSVTSWVGQSEELGHPDWDQRRCGGMESLTAFALREYLDTNTGLSSAQVCKKLFLTLGAVHRVDQIVNDAWSVSLRAPPGLGLTTAPSNDEEMKALMAEATKFADALFSKLRGQKQAFDAANNAKMDVKAFEAAPIANNAPEPPSLPDLEDVDASLITIKTSHLRRWGQ